MIEQVIDIFSGLIATDRAYGIDLGDIENDANIQVAAQAIVDLSKHECEWEFMKGFHHETRLYKTGCGTTHQYRFAIYCPYCGGEIKEIT